MNLESINFSARVLAFTVVCFYLVAISYRAWKALRGGVSPLAVGAGVATALIGLILGIAGAVAGGFGAYYVTQPYLLTPGASLMVQVAGAVLGALLADSLYERWVAPRVNAWFTEEEGGSNG